MGHRCDRPGFVISDFIQKQRAAIRDLKASFGLSRGTREALFHWRSAAKQRQRMQSTTNRWQPTAPID